MYSLEKEELFRLNLIISELMSILEKQKFYQSFLHLIEPVIKFDSAVVAVAYGNKQVKIDEPKVNIDEKFVVAYQNYYRKIDPNLDLVLPNRTITLRFSDFNPIEKIKHSEFFTDFLKPQQHLYHLAAKYCVQDLPLGGLCLIRHNDNSNFTDKEIKYLKYLTPYIVNCLNNIATFSQHDLNKEIIETLSLDEGIGILVLDCKFKVIYKNKKSEDLVGLDILEKIITNCMNLKQSLVKSETDKLVDSFFKKEKNYYKIKTRVVLNENNEHVYINLIEHPKIINQFSQLDVLGLTEREKEIANLLIYGYSNLEIAQQLFIGVETVKSHVSNIYKKLNIRNRNELNKILFNRSL